MINFELNKSDYSVIKDLNIISVLNRHKLDVLSDDMKSLITFFNTEYNWDGMFNFDDVHDRISKGHYLFILYYGHIAIGYIFYEPKDNDEIYLYNLYVTNCKERPEYSPIWFVNKSISLLPIQFKKISCVCEDWNTAAHNVFKVNNFKTK
jgi:hypothetical protein